MLDLIIKPQNKKGRQTLNRVEKRLVSEGIPYEVHFTEGKGMRSASPASSREGAGASLSSSAATAP